MSDLAVVVEKYAFLEGPRWHDGRIWVSDFYTHQVVSADEHGGDLRVEAQVPAQPSGLGWLPDGRLLIVSMRDHRLLRREPDGALSVHADVSSHAGGLLNDMVVDSRGRTWVGNFGFDLMAGAPIAPAPLVRVDPDGSSTVASEPLHFPNGAVITGSTMIVWGGFGASYWNDGARYDPAAPEYRDPSADCPVANRFALEEQIVLPHPVLLGTRDDVEDVARAIEKLYERRTELAQQPAIAVV